MSESILNGTGHGAPSLGDVNRLTGEVNGLEGEYPNCVKVGAINTNAATPAEDSLNNIKENIKTCYPRLHELPEFEQIHTKDEPIILVGGGPSLKNNCRSNELIAWSKYGPVITCGSSHDWYVENIGIPDYCVACDPDPIMSNYFAKANRKTLFLLSTATDPSVVKKLKGFNIAFWHCHSDANEAAVRDLEIDYQAVGGGCTVGLRSISIAIIMGYSNLHFFGFDSCMAEKDHHAYEFTDETKEFIGKIYRMRIGFNGSPGDKVYEVAGYQLAQADHFKKFYQNYSNYFTPTFHGPGLLPDMMKAIEEKSKTLNSVNQSETLGVQL